MFFRSKKDRLSDTITVDERLKHIAFIMDGNGRWAKKRSLPREYGHKVGAQTFKKIALYCGDIGIKYVTIYAFSTENWKRPEREVNAIMTLLSDYLDEAKRDLDKNNVRYIFIGDKAIFSEDLREKMIELEEISKDKPLTLNFAVNYGGRDEIKNAVKKIIASGVSADDITEELISKNLYTKNYPDPELIIRPSGEYRLSNFLIWQGAYSEFWYSNVLWPDFTTDDLDNAIRDYNKRNRRFGGV